MKAIRGYLNFRNRTSALLTAVVRFCVFCCALILSLKASAGISGCQDEDALYSPVVELAKGNKQVLIVGFFHYSPKDYFERAKALMEKWIAQEPSRVSILTELYTCRSPVLEIKPGSRLRPDQLDSLARSPTANQTLLSWIMKNQTDLASCRLDIDGKTLRPSYVVERNLTAQKSTRDGGIAMQWDLAYPQGPNVTLRSGDLFIDAEPPGAQVLASLGYIEDWDFTEVDKPENEALWSRVFNWFMLDIRNQRVAAEAKREFKSSNRVLIPWGAGHVEGIEKILLNDGFEVKSRGTLQVASLKNPNLPAKYRQRLQEWKKDLPFMGEACPFSPLTTPKSTRTLPGGASTFSSPVP